MSEAEVFSILQSALAMALVLSMPVLLSGVLVGVVVSLFQAVTQINDSTLSLVPKIIAVFAALAVFGPWMAHEILRFTVQMLTHVPGGAS